MNINKNKRERIMTTTNVISDIVSGEYDDSLNEIIRAVSDRRDIVGRIKTATISIGDKVKFNDHIRPKYLAGSIVDVKKVNKKTVVCDFSSDPVYGRFSNAKNVKVPTSTIDVV
jgi:hypothetical protein